MLVKDQDVTSFYSSLGDDQPTSSEVLVFNFLINQNPNDLVPNFTSNDYLLVFLIKMIKIWLWKGSLRV